LSCVQQGWRTLNRLQRRLTVSRDGHELRALRDLRQYDPASNIRSAAQVEIAKNR